MEFLKKIISPVWIILVKLFPTTMTKLYYRVRAKKKLNLQTPTFFNEKLQWLKLYKYHHNPLITKCVDKYTVRDYVRNKGCEELLIPLIGVYDTVDEIDWRNLPKRFVLKCNHGCRMNIICRNKEELDIPKTIETVRKWMKAPFGYNSVELIYEDVKRKIIIEELIETEDQHSPKDYKFFCSYGEPKFLYVASDRNGLEAKFDHFYPDWKWIPVRTEHPNSGGNVERPELLEEMLDYARKLSAGFPIVRVDLYCEKGKILFSELTFLHHGGVGVFYPPKYNTLFGDLFPIREIEYRDSKQ